MQPNLKFLFSHPAHFIALGAGSGLSRVAPGTVGTAFGWASWGVIQSYVPAANVPQMLAAQMLGVLLLALLAGTWASKITAEHMEQTDPGNIVIDEIVAFWLILWLITPCSWLMQLVAFVLFRYLDAAKPLFIGLADQYFKGEGWRGAPWSRAFGIMFDDLVAAFVVVLGFALLMF